MGTKRLVARFTARFTAGLTAISTAISAAGLAARDGLEVLSVRVGRLLPAPSRASGPFLPLRSRAFWTVQALVVVIALLHTAVETVAAETVPPELSLVPYSLFFMPVIYATLRFGFQGAVLTALWIFAVSVPNFLFIDEAPDRFNDMWQGTILMGLAIFVGVAVDRAHTARTDAEAREAARMISERRYRALYDRAAEAVLVVDGDWRIEEANASAVALLGWDAVSLVGRTFEEAAGPELAANLRACGARGEACSCGPRLLVSPSGRHAWIQAMGAVALSDGTEEQHGRDQESQGRSGGRGQEPQQQGGRDQHQGARFQVILRDVTLQFERQLDLEAWARHDIDAREEERKRIGRELHDGPVQSLVLLARKLDLLADAGRDGTGEPGVGGVGEPGAKRGSNFDVTLAEADEIIEETAAELRRVSRALRPPILDDLGLVAAIRSETGELGHRSGIATVFLVDGGQRPLPEDTELLLLRVAQESLHNAERHSGAASVEVSLAFTSARARLVVADDGRGIGVVPSAATLLEQGKLGLVGMFERVRLARGTIEVADRPAGGMTVSIEVPAPTRA